MRRLDRRSKAAVDDAAHHLGVAIDHLVKLGAGAPEKLRSALEGMASAEGQPRAVRQEARNLLAKALGRQDPLLLKRGVLVARKMEAAFRDAVPHADPQLVDNIVSELEDLWELGQRLDKEIKKLFGMRFPRDQALLADLLRGILVRHLEMGAYHIRSLTREIPELLRILHQSPHANGGRSRNSK